MHNPLLNINFINHILQRTYSKKIFMEERNIIKEIRLLIHSEPMTVIMTVKINYFMSIR
jgi:hypothetical protein